MPVTHKEIVKLHEPDPQGRTQFQVSETVERYETRVATIEGVENMIAYHEAQIEKLQIELEELRIAEVSPSPIPPKS